MKRILVIEDDEAVRGLIVETLKIRQWQVLSSPDGEDGITAALSELPDLILCDINMPRKDGFEVLRELRKNKATATTPFIFLTGMNERPGMRQAMELGADDYLAKPFSVKELLSAVDARFKKEDLIVSTQDEKLEQLRENLTFALPHELVTPLNSILGFSDLILDSVSSAEVKEYASLIRSAAVRLNELIEKFLLYAQIQAAAADPQQRAAAAVGPASETADVVIAASERASLQAGRREDLRVQADSAEHGIQPAHLARIVRELLENAFKFSERGTPVELASCRENSHYFLSVTDSGRGFTPEEIRLVGAHLQFDRRSQEQQGTGLGLAICRRIAELYGGTLEIQSSPGQRTCVTVRLPA